MILAAYLESAMHYCHFVEIVSLAVSAANSKAMENKANHFRIVGAVVADVDGVAPVQNCCQFVGEINSNFHEADESADNQ